MARRKCKECGRTADTASEKCELCGGEMVDVNAPKRVTPKRRTSLSEKKFSGESDMGRESPGDFTPVAVRAIKPKVPHRTILNIGRQDRHKKSYTMKTVGGIIVTLILAAALAFSIRYLFGDYNVKFGTDNIEKRQSEQMND